MFNNGILELLRSVSQFYIITSAVNIEKNLFTKTFTYLVNKTNLEKPQQTRWRLFLRVMASFTDQLQFSLICTSATICNYCLQRLGTSL